jgi:hypothetical protein
MGTSEIRIEETFDRVERHFEDEIDEKIFAARRRPPDLSVFSQGLAGADVRAALEEEQRLKELIFGDQLHTLIALVQEGGIPLVLTTLPQEAFVPPALSGTQKQETKEIREAITKLDYKKGMELDDQVAIFHFEHAQQLWRQGKTNEAIQAFERSVSLDLVPDSTPEINQIIRDVAEQHDVPLVDLRMMAWEYAGNPRDFFLDSVHLNPQGAHIVGMWLSTELKAQFPQLLPQ